MSSSAGKSDALSEMLADADDPQRRRDFDLPPDLPETAEEGLRRTFALCAALESELEKHPEWARRPAETGDFIL